MTRHHLQVWTPEADAILSREWEKGTSARDIASMLTTPEKPVSRNSVLGRAYRKGFATHEKGVLRKTPAPCRAAPNDGPTGCRYIHGEPNGYQTKWCDAPVSEIGGSWCAEHRALVYRPRESEEGNTTPPHQQRTGTVILLPTIAPMRVFA
jgi:hypothetical protein